MTTSADAPLLVGVGSIEQRFDDPSSAVEPLALMVEATRRAAQDAGSARLLEHVDVVSVPRGRWRYEDPGASIARSIGALSARTILAHVGVLQQTLIGDACSRIANGDADVVVVVGGEARHRRLRADITGIAAPESDAPGTPSESWHPDKDMVLPLEVDAGLGGMPVGYYALVESALAHRRGVDIDTHRDNIANLYARFSEIAAANPHAWRRQRLDPSAIRNPSPDNRMLAFPYTKHHVTTWTVDQAAALIFCSTRRADDLGIAPARRIYPLASSESNYMTAVSERADLTRCAGAEIAATAALAHAGLAIDDIDLVELYSCFPAAVQVYADAIRLPDGQDRTVTGGMPFAGGPFNSYVLHATCRAVELLRSRPQETALVSSVSGILTKQGYGLWSTRPAPMPFASLDVTNQVAAATDLVTVRPANDEDGTIAATTVLHPDKAPPRAVALVDLTDGSRTVVSSLDAALIEAFERTDQCGHPATVRDGTLRHVDHR